MKNIVYYATGKRKTSVARTWLKSGNGTVMINDRPVENYFAVETYRSILFQPLLLTNTKSLYDIIIKVKGGGVSGQAGAIRHGITKALLLIQPEYRQILKKNGLITRDHRIKERKKYGQRGARARFQFSKR